MDLKTYFDQLGRVEQNAFASRYGKGFDYVKKFLLSPSDERRRIPSPLIMSRLIDASNGDLTWLGVLSWFYPHLQDEIDGIGVASTEKIAPETETNREGQSMSDASIPSGNTGCRHETNRCPRGTV